MKRVLVLLMVAGCGTAGDTQAVEDLIQSIASQQCEWEFRCCNDTEIRSLDGGKFADSGDCTPYRALALETELYLNKLAASEGRLKVDSTQADACIAQMQAKACNGTDDTAAMMDPMTMMDACAHVFVGTTSVGNECVYEAECETGSRCVGDPSAVGRGVCVPYQAVGDICNADSDCDPTIDNVYCAKADFHCHVRGTFGQPCQYTTDANGKNPSLPLVLECDSAGALFCDVATSTCKQLPADGDPCIDPLPPGVSTACNPDPKLNLVCDKTSSSSSGGICRAPVGVGESCENISCAKDLYCDSVSYTCKALPGLGQVCSQTNYQCAAPFSCVYNAGSYTCDQPASISENCVNPPRTCETDAYCDSSGTQACEPKLGDGAQCTSSIQCVSDSCGFQTGGTHDVCLSANANVMCSGH